MASLQKIKQGDTVRILRGKDAGKKGKVMAVLPKLETLVVEGLNMVKKHVKAKSGGQQFMSIMRKSLLVILMILKMQQKPTMKELSFFTARLLS